MTHLLCKLGPKMQSFRVCQFFFQNYCIPTALHKLLIEPHNIFHWKWKSAKERKVGVIFHSWYGGSYSPFLDQPPPFSKIPPFLEIQDVPTFHRFIRKRKVLNNFCNQFVCNFYPQSILVLEECLQKW